MWGEGTYEGLRKIDPVMLIIQGCVCGGVIYISCSDLIAREFQGSQDINPRDVRDDGAKRRNQICISAFKLFHVMLGAAFVLAFFTAGGSDLTGLDSTVRDSLGQYADLSKVDIKVPKVSY